jgi:hypothetical protein
MAPIRPTLTAWAAWRSSALPPRGACPSLPRRSVGGAADRGGPLLWRPTSTSLGRPLTGGVSPSGTSCWGWPASSPYPPPLTEFQEGVLEARRQLAAQGLPEGQL